jgi:hypothetical protein
MDWLAVGVLAPSAPFTAMIELGRFGWGELCYSTASIVGNGAAT